MVAVLSVQSNSRLLLLRVNFHHSTQNPIKPFAALDTAYKMRVPYQLKEGQNRLFHKLPTGLNMEVIYQKGVRRDPDEEETLGSNSPLVFIHGSFHAAWCWGVHWLPFFSGHGHDCYAVSLLGQGESDAPEGPAAGTLQTHAMNVADFILKEIRSPPVLLGHSFGGLIVQSYISNIGCYSGFGYLYSEFQSVGNGNLHPTLAGAVLLCSVPPSGNSGVVWRYLFSKPVAAFKVTMSLAAKAFATSLTLCKETFFSKEMEDHLVQRYQELMKESSRMPLFDLKKLNKSLPVPVPKSSVKIFVMGASNDFIVDEKGLRETARFYGVLPVCVEGIAHDMMLDCSWEKGAQVILSWLKDLNREDPL